MQSKLKNGLLALAASAFVLAVLAPVAQAQTASSLTFTVDTLPGVLKPEIGSGKLQLTFTYHLQNNVVPELGNVAATETVTVAFDCGAQNNNVHINGSTTVLITVNPGTTQKSDFSQIAPYTVTVTRDAPGLKLMKCTITATGSPLVTQGSAVPAPTAPGAQTFDVQADYFPLIQANVDTKILEGGPQKSVPFDVQLSNFGNAQTTITFALGDPKPDANRWKTIVPEQITLDSPTAGTGTSSGVRKFEISTPFHNGWNNEDQQFTLVMTPTATLDSSKAGLPVTVTVLARDRGIYVPGFDPVLMLVAVVGAAMLVRLKKLGQ